MLLIYIMSQHTSSSKASVSLRGMQELTMPHRSTLLAVSTNMRFLGMSYRLPVRLLFASVSSLNVSDFLHVAQKQVKTAFFQGKSSLLWTGIEPQQDLV